MWSILAPKNVIFRFYPLFKDSVLGAVPIFSPSSEPSFLIPRASQISGQWRHFHGQTGLIIKSIFNSLSEQSPRWLMETLPLPLQVVSWKQEETIKSHYRNHNALHYLPYETCALPGAVGTDPHPGLSRCSEQSTDEHRDFIPPLEILK